MPIRLSREEIVSIYVLASKGQNHCEIARALKITEGTVRYHLGRKETGAADGRQDKTFKVSPWEDVIREWMEARRGDPRPANVRELYDQLLWEHHYEGSYKSVLRYVRRHWPKPKIRTYRRVETPPGAQSQTDWAEYPRVDVGQGPEALSAFVMVLSHSRRPAIVWSRQQDLVSWLSCHNASFERLQGVAAVNRIDNVKTAVIGGAGAWGILHPSYKAYARAVGFHIDACAPGQANQKGKVEAKVKLSRLLLNAPVRRWDSLEELQIWTDRRIDQWAARAVCPATGKSVSESWEAELARLAPLPLLPEPFDVVVQRPVHRDCMVRFEDHLYPVPFHFVGRHVEVRGCAGTVQIWSEGRKVREYPRHSPERILLDRSCYEGEATDRVIPPPPLGKMGRRLQEILEMPVERRPLDLYAALAEVAR